jgi:hypothetical protein
MNCGGWRVTVAQHREIYGPSPSSAAADEGTQAHERFEALLKGLPNFVGGPIEDPLSLDEADPLFPPYQWVAAQPGELYAESRIDFGSQFDFVDLGGTVDVTLVEPDRLTIADLKFGYGIVEAGGNAQLMTYLSGAVQKFGPRGIYRIAVLQPRAWHLEGSIRVLSVTPDDLDAFNVRLERAIKANYRNAVCTPGDHCRNYCPALASCPAVAAAARKRFLEPIE